MFSGADLELWKRSKGTCCRSRKGLQVWSYLSILCVFCLSPGIKPQTARGRAAEAASGRAGALA